VGITYASGESTSVGRIHRHRHRTDDVTDTVKATIDDSVVTAEGNIELNASSTGTVEALAIAGAVGVASSQSSQFSISGAGAGVKNTVTNTVEAGILNGSTVETTNGASVSLTARDHPRFTADAGGVALALATGSGSSSSVAAASACLLP